jgi:hypothetical protein
MPAFCRVVMCAADHLSLTAPSDSRPAAGADGTGYVGVVSDDVTIEPGQRWIGGDDVPDIEIIQEAGTGAWVIQTTYIWTEDYIRDNYRLSSVGDD